MKVEYITSITLIISTSLHFIEHLKSTIQMLSLKRSSILSIFLFLTTILPSPLPTSSPSTSTIPNCLTKFDAEDATIILTWLQNPGFDFSQLVFYSNPTIALPMVDAFIQENIL